MTRDEMYELLKRKFEETNWKDLESIRQYNEYARQVRSEYEKSLE